MTPTSYTLTFSENERSALIFALGNVFPSIRDGVGMFVTPADFLSMSKRVMDAKPDAQAARAQSGTAAAAAIAAPAPAPVAAPGDHWAADKKGNRFPPEQFESKNLVVVSVTPGKTSNNADFWKVVFRGAKANCFDRELAAHLTNAAAQNRAMTVHLVKSGNYSNIAGVRA